MMNKKKRMIVANLATFPKRKKVLKKTIDSILPQVDVLNIYLNNYKYIPSILQNHKINCVLGDEADGDLKDNGKFYFLNKCPNDAYYFTIDDDITYPKNYIDRLISEIDRYDDKIAVGVHGVIFFEDFKNFRDSRTNIHFEDELNKNIKVSVLGTGTVAFYKNNFKKLFKEDFCDVGMADLYFSIFCKNNNIQQICVTREKEWLKNSVKNRFYSISLWQDSVFDTSKQDILIEQNRLWQLKDAELNKYRTVLENQLKQHNKSKYIKIYKILTSISINIRNIF